MTVYALWIMLVLTTPSVDQILDVHNVLVGVYNTAEQCEQYRQAFSKTKQPSNAGSPTSVSAWAECKATNIAQSKKGS